MKLHLRASGCHLPYGNGTHSVTYHPTQVNTPRLNPSLKPVLDLPTLEGWKAELTWWSVTYRDGLPARRRSPIQVLKRKPHYFDFLWILLYNKLHNKSTTNPQQIEEMEFSLQPAVHGRESNSHVPTCWSLVWRPNHHTTKPPIQTCAFIIIIIIYFESGKTSHRVKGTEKE